METISNRCDIFKAHRIVFSSSACHSPVFPYSLPFLSHLVLYKTREKDLNTPIIDAYRYFNEVGLKSKVIDEISFSVLHFVSDRYFVIVYKIINFINNPI